MGTEMFRLGDDTLEPFQLVNLAKTVNPPLKVSQDRWNIINKQRAILDQAIAENKTVYGVNTGFGYLSNVRIEKEQIKNLQINLIRSHACGVGDPLANEIVRGMMIVKAHNFLLGHSGISRPCVETLLSFLQHDIIPSVPSKGSVGASGDLAPLAHIALAMISEGSVSLKNSQVASIEVFKQLDIPPFSPGAKEGLSLINGTQYMSTEGSFALFEAQNLTAMADVAIALSLEGFDGTIDAFDPKIHQLRRHDGQIASAANIYNLLTHGKSRAKYDKVQDPYSFRCAPQVHGTTRMTIDFVEKILRTEINSITDNPLVFDNGEILSGGNFHGEPIACAFDYLAIALSEIGNISERRIEKLTNPNMSGLPAFLTENSGLSSGMMIPQVVAASLVSENKVLSHPASVDSIPTSADKEDHVSMGAFAARKLRMVCKNVAWVLAIELISACQAISLRKVVHLSPRLQKAYDRLRSYSPFLDKDRSLQLEIEQVAKSLLNGEF